MSRARSRPSRSRCARRRIGIGNDECLIYPETLLENIVSADRRTQARPGGDRLDTDHLHRPAGLVGGKRVADPRMRRDAAEIRQIDRNVDLHHRPHHQGRKRSPGPRSWNTSSTWSCNSKATATTSTASCAASRTVSARRSKSGCSRCSTAGLRSVDNPSEILLTHYEEPLSGIAVGASADGVRPYLIEVQALVSGAAYGTPQRSTTGYDSQAHEHAAGRAGEARGNEDVPEGRLPEFRRRVQGRRPGIRPGSGRGGDLVVLRPPRRPRGSAARAKSGFRAKCAPHPAPNSASARPRAWDSNASSSRGIWARAPNAPRGSRS